LQTFLDAYDKSFYHPKRAMQTEAAKPHSPPIKVGIAGLGRSGWKIHAETLAAMGDKFTVVAVTDQRAERQAEAKEKFGCKAYDDIQPLLAQADVELVVIATPNHLHAQQAIAAMVAGKHVLCEKPFAMSTAEADQVIATSNRTGRVLSIYQNRRFDPHFQKVREIITSGVLGRIVEVRFTWHYFSRRWDWQTLKEFGGGMLNNAGAHFLDQLLFFFGNEMPRVACYTDRALTLGDADDHCVVMLSGKDKPLVQMELSSVCGYPQVNWLIMGTRGALHGTFDKLQWKIAQFDQVPTPVLNREPMPDRSYNSEKIPWQEFNWEASAEEKEGKFTHRRFYESLYQTLRHGAGLVVTPEQVRLQMRVLDECRKH
jgi:predicted dehydrogenase